MRLGFAACLLLLSLLSLPMAAAQAPPLPPAPEPGAAVALACAALGGPAPEARDLVPLCPQVDPAGPAPQDDAHAHDPASVPGTPQDVPSLAAEVVEDLQQIPEDPAGAPERLAAIVATVLQFLRDLVSLPARGLDAAGGGIERLLDGIGDAAVGAAEAVVEGSASVRDAVGGAIASGVDAAKKGVGDLGAALRAMLDPVAPELPVEAPDARGHVRDARDAADGLRELARGEARRALSEA